MKLPTFLVCGAGKSGTTSLYHYLQQHPDVLMGSPKEPNFFNRHYDKGLDWYASSFQEWSGETAVGEASTSTMLFASLTAERIANTIPDAKLIFLLRNPIDRLFSDYWFNVRQGRISDPQSCSFSRFIRKETTTPARWPDDASEEDIAVKRGRYDRQIQEFDRYFDASQMLILISEDLKDNRSETLRHIYRFIGVDAEFKPLDRSKKNRGRYVHHRKMYEIARKIWGPIKAHLPNGLLQASQRLRTALRMHVFFDGQKPQMKTEDRIYLRNLYADTISGIERRLGRDLSHWR